MKQVQIPSPLPPLRESRLKKLKKNKLICPLSNLKHFLLLVEREQEFSPSPSPPPPEKEKAYSLFDGEK